MAGIALGAGCSAKHDPAGGLLLSVDTNLKVPDDIDTIGISVSRATDGGVESEDDLFPLAPNGTAKFPATLTLLRGTDEPLQIRAVGYKDGAAIALRQVVTTLPADHVAVLPLELNWLDKPLVSGTATESVRSVTSSCGALESPVAGTCSSFTLDSASLATYAPSAVVPSDGAAAVDCDTCFASGQTVTPDPATCTFTPPAGVTNAAAINVAFKLAAGHTAGWCNGGSCIIPLPNDPVEGWSLGSDGLIHLPAAACTSAAVGSVFVVPATAGCPVVSAAHPPAQVYVTDDGGMTPIADAGGDAAAVEGGVDASSDAGPTPPPVALKHPNVLSLASDPTHLFVLSDGGMAIEIFSLAFATSATATPIMVPSLQTTGHPESAAAFPYFAVVDSANQVVVVNTNTPTNVDQLEGTGESGANPTLTDLGTGNFSLGWLGTLGANAVTFANNALPTENGNSSIDDDAFAMGIDPTCPASTPCYVASGENDENQYYLTTGGGSAGRFQTNLDRAATQFAFPYTGTPDQHVAWSDATGAIYFWNGTTWSSVEPAGTMVTTERALAASSGRLFWIGGTSNSLFTATISAQGAVGTATPVAVGADGGAATAVQQVIVQGTELIWFDATGIYRQDTTLLQ